MNDQDSNTSFDSGEHALLGDTGYKQACDANCPSYIKNSAKLEFSYGELVAFSGDFYQSPDDVDKEKDAKKIATIKNAFNDEKQSTKAQMVTVGAKYADEDVTYVLAWGTEFLDLASKNLYHFGWHNMKEYVKRHGEALAFALQAYNTSDPTQKAELFRKALLTNGYADHFLTDGFASGHIRNPRLEGMNWASPPTCAPQKTAQFVHFPSLAIDKDGMKRAGVLAKLLHDSDHSYAKTQGLKVINAQGDHWKTRADGQLFIMSQMTDPQIAYPVKAVALSVGEILKAYTDGEMPETVYSATYMVPFVDPSEDTLASTYSGTYSNAQLDDMAASFTPMWKLSATMCLTYDYARSFLSQLPTLMDQFRQHVAADVAANPELTKRLPTAYIDGFRAVQ